MRATYRRGARGLLVVLALAGCSGDESGTGRPDAAEMNRRAPLVMAALAMPPSDADVSGLPCILDEPYDSPGYQAGMADAELDALAAWGVIACSADEWDDLPEAIGTLAGIDPILVEPVVLVATLAVDG
jgi:hypothetical protein